MNRSVFLFLLSMAALYSRIQVQSFLSFPMIRRTVAATRHNAIYQRSVTKDSVCWKRKESSWRLQVSKTFVEYGDDDHDLFKGDKMSLDKVMDRRNAGKAVVELGLAATMSICIGRNTEALAQETLSKRFTIPDWKLQGGVRMPTLALNTVGLSTEDTKRAVAYAYSLGMFHIDFHPGKERDGVAKFLKENLDARSKLFLNTKIRKAPPGTSPQDAADRTRQQIQDDLNALGVPQVDMLMLRDSPDPKVIQAQWKVMEEALSLGLTRSVGVINFCQLALEAVMQTTKVTPSLNYYMLHIGMGRDAHGLRTFGENKGIRSFAYGAVGEPGPSQELLSNPLLRTIGSRHGKTPEQVALRWVLQTGVAVSVRPTLNFGLGYSVCPLDRCYNELAARAESFDWSLSEKEMAQLDAVPSPDDNPTLFSSAGCPGAFVMPT